METSNLAFGSTAVLTADIRRAERTRHARPGARCRVPIGPLALVIAWLWVTICAFATQAVAQEVFYVDPAGNDANAGTAGAPLASMQGAVDRVRSVIDGQGDITVNFNSGTYVFSSTVVLGAADSGSAGQVITYQATPGHTPVFTSLVPLTGWTTHQGSIQVADVPAGIGQVRFLRDASEDWLPRSATEMFNPATIAFQGSPESEHFEPQYQVNKTFSVYPAGFSAPDWSVASQYDLRIKNMPWTAQVLKIANVDAGARRINVEVPGHYSLNDGLDDLRTEAWVMNSIAGIDAPGEWAQIDDKIYLYPLSGTADIHIPALTELVRVDDGTVDGNAAVASPIRFIHFDGITFTGGDYRPMEANDITVQHDWQVVDVASGLLRLRNAENCVVRNCAFTHSGGDGVRLDRYAQSITIENSEFHYLGRTAITLSGRGAGWGDVNKNNTIASNHISTTGRIKWDAPAIMLDQASGNLVTGNYIEDIYMSAVIMTGGRSSIVGERIADQGVGGIINRSMHWAEIAQSVLDFGENNALEQTAQFFYDYDNVIELNTFRDVHSAPFFTTGGMSNGVIYLTGTKLNETEYIRKNYFYDLQVNGTEPNGYDTWLFLGDGFEDFADADQNMIHNMQAGDAGLESAEVLNTNCNQPNGQCWHRANVIQNSTFEMFENTAARNAFFAGNIDFDSGTPGGDVSFVAQYEEMWSLLCPGILPGPSPLPGSTQMQANLAGKISEFGGTVPTCAGGSCTVPDVVGLSQTAAEASVQSASLMVGSVSSQPSGSVPPGDVISQSVAAGTQIACGGLVGLTVSTGASTTTTTTPPMSTTTTTLPGEAACAPVPRSGCRGDIEGRASIKLTDKGVAKKNALKWTWIDGDETLFSELGDPSSSTDYAVCLYDYEAASPSLAVALEVPPGDLWRSSGETSWKYRDKTAGADGLKSLQIRSSDAGIARIKLNAKGALLPLPGPLDDERYFAADGQTRIQLVNGLGYCWESSFPEDTVGKNSSVQYRAKHKGL